MALCDYKLTIGLEIHVELKTATKIFCSCPTSFGKAPNTACCPVCMGHPGALPALNRTAVELAILAGVLLECTVEPISRFDRKQYFYPDLPKAYQITQGANPVCRNGALTFSSQDGVRKLRIRRIHLEEDAGKLIHTADRTLIDYNRCSVPLIEIVTEPDLHSAREAADALRTLRGILASAGVSDCKMEEGSLRCDVNLSLCRCGEEGTGVRTEIKNINSFSFVEKAIQFEAQRQAALLDGGVCVVPETRRYDSASGMTVRMRRKEGAGDYRMIPEPNLPPIRIDSETIERIRGTIPELPDARLERWMNTFGITRESAMILLNGEGAVADYAEQVMEKTEYPQTAVHFLLTERLTGPASSRGVPSASVFGVAQVSNLFGGGVINSVTAKKLLARLTVSDFSVIEAVEREGLRMIGDEESLRKTVREVLLENPRAVSDYQNGKTAAAKALLGKAMSKTHGLADPVKTERILISALKEK